MDVAYKIVPYDFVNRDSYHTNPAHIKIKKRDMDDPAFIVLLAGGPGFEPGLAESESAVLPLDDPPVGEYN